MVGKGAIEEHTHRKGGLFEQMSPPSCAEHAVYFTTSLVTVNPLVLPGNPELFSLIEEYDLKTRQTHRDT